MTRPTLLLLTALALAAGSGHAQADVEYVESTNEGGWAYGGPDTIETSGGNPGAYLRSNGLDTCAPTPGIFRSATGSFPVCAGVSWLSRLQRVREA